MIRLLSRILATVAVCMSAALLVAEAGPVNPPFVPQFGVGAPSGTVPKSQLYFDVSPSPYAAYVYRNEVASWEAYGGGGGGGGCSGTAGAILISSTGTNCIGDSATSDGAGNWSGIVTQTYVANRVDDPGDITVTSNFNVRANSLSLEGQAGTVDIGTDGASGHDVNITGYDVVFSGGNQTTVGAAGQPLQVDGDPTIGNVAGWKSALGFMPCTATASGLVPTPPNDATQFLDGTCHFSTPSGGGSGPDLFSPPAAAGFTAFTGDLFTPTLADQSYGMVASIGASASTNIIRGALQALPATPWVMVARLRSSATPFSFRGCGPAISDGTKYTTFTWGNFGYGSPNNLYINTWATGAINAGTLLQTAAAPGNEYFQITDDGTTRVWSISADGRNWAEIFQETHTNFLTPTQIGIACQPLSSAGPSAGVDNLFVTVLYWSVT